jgi:energy-coupling factor transporter ATP-binding protein EcfA2
MGRNFIEKILIGEYQSANKHELIIAHPDDQNHQYCVTVICGKNNTGKTHILNQLNDTFQARRKFHNVIEKESINVHVVLTDPEAPPPNVLYFNSTTFAKSRFNVIPLGEYKNDPGGRKPQYRNAAIRFIGKQLRAIFGEQCDPSLWSKDASYRLRFASKNIGRNLMYHCSRDDILVTRFEQAVGGQLYFRRYEQDGRDYLELALRYDQHRVFRYSKWSDGQQTLLAGFLIIDYHKPDVLLIDEIENHFHPEYITHLSMFIKEVVPQTILVTHHPHMLFSKLVDKLYYMQLGSINDEMPPPPTEPFDKTHHPRSYRRNIKELTSDFDLITAAYGLFHNQDRQLLHLAEKLHGVIDFKLTKALIQLFQGEAVQPGASTFIDSQTAQLLSIIKESVDVPKHELEILDYGAGRGRTLLEVLKVSQAKRGFTFRWSFWERDAVLREYLASLNTKLSASYEINVIDDIAAVPQGKFHIAILSNVLHEVTPVGFAEIFSEIRRVIDPKVGKFIILELYPLVHPEKYAVPYVKERMELIVHNIGWKFDSGFFPIRNGLIQAYWVCAHSPDASKSSNQEHIRTEVENAWEQILRHNCLLYDGKYKITSADDQIKIMDNLTTIASIMNYKMGNWV